MRVSTAETIQDLGRNFWELDVVANGWEFQQTTTRETNDYRGYENIFLWENGEGQFSKYVASLDGRLGGSWKRGGEAWGKYGVSISQMSNLPASLYIGTLFDSNIAVIIPHDPNNLPAVWAYCKSSDFAKAVRRIDQKVNVTNATLGKILLISLTGRKLPMRWSRCLNPIQTTLPSGYSKARSFPLLSLFKWELLVFLYITGLTNNPMQ